jgi:CIC family chloride channel protein
MTAAVGQRSLQNIRRIRSWVRSLTSSETFSRLLIALAVGICTGIATILFRRLIGLIERFSFDQLAGLLKGLGPLYLVLIPAAGGLLTGLLIHLFAPEAKGHGVPAVIEAVALRGGRIRPIVALVKGVASAITIGTGGSAGWEGPVVQMGSAIGSAFGQLLRLSPAGTRTLLACGAAAGLSGVFNAPIAGVIFSLEGILGDFSASNFGLIVIASVTSAAISRAAFGSSPAFIIPTYTLRSPWEFGLYALLGVLAAPISALFVRALVWTEDRFEEWERVPSWIKPAVGGALLGIFAIIYGLFPGLGYEHVPHVFGNSYSTIELALAGAGVTWVMVALIFLKIIATSLTLGSGGSGGIFAPSLFFGAMLGGAYGHVVAQLFPDIAAPAGAYALVGMAATFAGIIGTPITAILLLFEMTGDYHIILPLMFAVVISWFASRAILHGETINSIPLARRGIRIAQGRDVDIMQGILVQEAMTPNPDTVPADMPLSQLLEEFDRTRHHGFPVLDAEGHLFGMVTLQDLQRALERGLPLDTPVSTIATRHPQVVFPDESMASALEKLGRLGVGRLPVVAREEPRKLVGIVRRDDILRAYNLALTRRAELQHRAAQLSLRRLDGTEFIEITIPPDAGCVGRTVRELSQALPADAVFVSIRRKNGQVLIPHGDTVIQAGDRITCFASSSAAQALQSCLIGGAAGGGEQRDVPA